MPSTPDVSRTTPALEVHLHIVFQTNPWGPYLSELRNLSRTNPEAFYTYARALITRIRGLPHPGRNSISWIDHPSPTMVLRWNFENLASGRSHIDNAGKAILKLNQDSKKKETYGILELFARVIEHPTTPGVHPIPTKPTKPTLSASQISGSSKVKVESVAQSSAMVPESPITYKTHIAARPVYIPLPSTYPTLWIDAQPDSLNIQEPALCIAALHEVVAQLRATHAQLKVAECHIDLMGSRDTSLLDRTREAEKMVRQSRSRAEQSENEARKLDQLSQAAQLRAKKAERRAFEAQETLTNVNRRLKGMIGPKNKWRYHQHGFRPPVSPSEQVIAHLDVLEAVIAEGLSADASCSLHPSPHSAPTVPPEVKRESVDHEHKLFEAVSARDTAESEVHTLTEKLATTEAQTTHMLHQIKEERDGAMSRLREAEGHVRDLQHELSQVKRDAATFETRLQGVNGLAAESAAKLKEAQKALSDTHSAFGHAVSRAEAAERDSRATQLALESLRAERESPIIVPALMDALRLIVQSAA